MCPLNILLRTFVCIYLKAQLRNTFIFILLIRLFSTGINISFWNFITKSQTTINNKHQSKNIRFCKRRDLDEWQMERRWGSFRSNGVRAGAEGG